MSGRPATTDDEVPGPRGPGRRVRVAVGAVLAASAVLVAFLVVGGRPAAAPRETALVLPSSTTTSSTTVPLPSAPAGSTLTAATRGAVPASVLPGQPAVGQVPATWYGYPTVLPVLEVVPGWVKVRMAQRPNGSTAWVPMADVTLSSTPYRIVVDLASEHVQLLRSGAQVASFPAGIGTTDDPTAPGAYFMTMKVPAPSSGYGPFVLVTSDHSNTITDWEGSGDAIIAIHGPIDSSADQEIGTTGARISHGCIRMHDADLAQLGVVPAGSPIDVIAGP